ncbi:hypothetical protein BN77_p30057 [Rhizobium mesoamericanum STM3625]|uniref:Uncharacterized protein n=1 Tax=Rhizobium mesoamericanum STM3625 TaxID=1211777 RepID=K0Q3V8_9HYPH|nr:hypothetical protein BN77_p30057 [Rhizobium mesoamericanum STM3625]
MKSIGEISIAAARKGGISGILVVREAGESTAAGASTSWPEGEAGPTAPRLRTPSYRPGRRSRP